MGICLLTARYKNDEIKDPKRKKQILQSRLDLTTFSLLPLLWSETTNVMKFESMLITFFYCAQFLYPHGVWSLVVRASRDN